MFIWSGKMDDLKKEEPGSGAGTDDRAVSEGDNNYKFIKQTIRKKPVDKKKWILRIVWTVVFGVGFGIIAAFVFAASAPAAARILGLEVENKRIVLTTGDELTPTPVPEKVAVSDVSAGSSVSSVSSSSQAISTSGLPVTGQELGDQDQGQNQEGTEEDASAANSLTLDDIRQLYGDMIASSREAQCAIVQVTGITNEMDYFRQNYENRQQVSGLIIARNNNLLYILTQQSVVDNVQSIQITFFDGTTADGALLSRDAATGFAVVTVDSGSVSPTTDSRITTAPLGSSYLVSQADPVLALGSPMGYGDTVSCGVVTSVDNTAETSDREYNLITTDIIGSTSGSGVLVNIYGKVVGIISQNFKMGDTGTVTALAISDISGLLETLTNHDPIPYAGITGQAVTQDISERTGIPEGELVTAVDEDSPAMLAGIKEYDVITEVNGKTIRSVSDYTDIVSASAENETLNIKAMRKGAEGYAEVDFTVTVKVR